MDSSKRASVPGQPKKRLKGIPVANIIQVAVADDRDRLIGAGDACAEQWIQVVDRCQVRRSEVVFLVTAGRNVGVGLVDWKIVHRNHADDYWRQRSGNLRIGYVGEIGLAAHLSMSFTIDAHQIFIDG